MLNSGGIWSATRAARAAIRDAVGKWSTVSYGLDLGNNADSGQFILGKPLNERSRRSELRLRTAAELFFEIVDPNFDNDSQPSCSAVESLERQEPFINSTPAQHALALLSRLFRDGEISYHGCFINLALGATSMLRIDPQCWRRTRRSTKHTTLLCEHTLHLAIDLRTRAVLQSLSQVINSTQLVLSEARKVVLANSIR